MWTCAIVLLTTRPSMHIAVAALSCGGKILLGMTTRWAFRWAIERLAGILAAGRALLEHGYKLVVASRNVS
jgi:hypothetical protein